VTLKSQLMRSARRAPTLLGDTAAQVLDFIRGQAAPDGAFLDRSGRSDLYYTVFGAQCLLALGQPLPPALAAAYLSAAGDGANLDFVHLTCLARCWSLASPSGPPPAVRTAILDRLAVCRTADGGYATDSDTPASTLYGCFLALAALQDLDAEIPDPDGLARSIERLALPDGGYSNDSLAPFATVPAAAAAIAILAELGRPVPPETARWLLGCAAPGGGFLVAPGMPVADLLSTATALHALASASVAIDEKTRTACLGFLLGLLTDDGGFRGHLADDAADCEYTFYGLLALGHLA
jgi:hypothetical protein